MTEATISFAELKGISLEDILLRVLREQLALKIRLADGKVVQIQPEPALESLPVLEGSVPDNWKDAIYA